MPFCYLESLFDKKEYTEVVNKAVKQLKELRKKHPFESIAFRGMSGAMIVPAIAHKLGVKMLMVRKEDGSHAWHKVEGDPVKQYIIIDDFIETGDTINEIIKQIKNNVARDIQCVGVYLYHKSSTNTKGNLKDKAKYISAPILNLLLTKTRKRV
jgi:orotate phosphoribosyltransferase